MFWNKSAAGHKNAKYIGAHCLLLLAIFTLSFYLLPISISMAPLKIAISAICAGLAYPVIQAIYNFCFAHSPHTLVNKKHHQSPVVVKIVAQQQATYKNIFLKYPKNFHQPIYHYDWWMFPVHAPAHVSPTSQEYSVTDKDVKQLLEHKLFISTYIKSIDQYLSKLKTSGWNNYDVRYAKMVGSLHQFICVANKQTSKDSMAKTKVDLHGLAKRAIQFANKNIKHQSTFLQSNLNKLASATAVKASFKEQDTAAMNYLPLSKNHRSKCSWQNDTEGGTTTSFSKNSHRVHPKLPTRVK